MASFIPNDILLDNILPRLSAIILMRFKCVSKTFNSHISSPYFIKKHLPHSRSSGYSNRLALIQLEIRDFSWFSCLDLNLIGFLDFSIHLPKIKNFKNLKLVGCCDGLICMKGPCLFDSSSFAVCLLNPSTGIFLGIPQFSHPTPCIFGVNFGFGYDPKKNDYKIVALVSYQRIDDDEFKEVDISKCDDLPEDRWRYILSFNLKGTSWKKVKICPPPQDYIMNDVNGVLTNNHLLHWFRWCFDEQHKISCFNLTTEDWERDVPLPPYDNLDDDDEIWGDKVDDLIHLRAIDGCLALLTNNPSHPTIDVWVMNRFSQSWGKLFTFSNSTVNYLSKFYPVAFHELAPDEVLVWKDSPLSVALIWCKITSSGCQELRSLKIDDRFKLLDVGVCRGSLLSLPGGIQLKKIKKNRPKKRLKVSSVFDQPGIIDTGATIGYVDYDKGGGLALNASSRALTVQKLDGSCSVSSVAGSFSSSAVDSIVLSAASAPMPVAAPGVAPLMQPSVSSLVGLPGAGFSAPSGTSSVADTMGVPSECLLLKNIFDPAEAEPDSGLDIKENMQA